VRDLAFLNAALETGIENPLDAAIIALGEREGLAVGDARKVDEIPYDFIRRRLTIVIEDAAEPARHHMISKGAFDNILSICSTVSRSSAPLGDDTRFELQAFFQARSEEGFRVLAVAEKRMPARAAYFRDDERDLSFAGFLLFADPPKAQANQTIRDLAELGIAIKIISGDNRHVTAHLAKAVGLRPSAMLTGEDLGAMRDEALWHVAPKTDLFVEIDPQQKQRIVRALQHAGHAVGYLGDGINDAPALHAADVGISVDQAVDIARESADIVLLRPDLDVLRQGVEDGRKTFANTLKYIAITTSANFGNMMSMALATPLLAFLPLLPKQILLNNFLSDLPSIAISIDNVDRDHIARPQRWNVNEVQSFMVVFGLTSSLFDGLTFAVLIFLLQAGETLFQTTWFVVSLLTELAVVLVLRTRGLAYRSRPSRLLLWTTIVVAILCLSLPLAGPLATAFGFVALPGPVVLGALAVVAAYVVCTELIKLAYYRWRARIGQVTVACKGPAGLS
jgi:Mg2+-importing ATPase